MPYTRKVSPYKTGNQKS